MSDQRKPLTDRELDLLSAGHSLVGETDEMTIARLVAEVRRLRALLGEVDAAWGGGGLMAVHGTAGDAVLCKVADEARR